MMFGGRDGAAAEQSANGSRNVRMIEAERSGWGRMRSNLGVFPEIGSQKFEAVGRRDAGAGCADEIVSSPRSAGVMPGGIPIPTG
jgi:hypothetical protein